MNDKILYVDDEENILAACRRSLGRTMNITTCSDPVRALDVLRDEGPFAVVLSDQRMPGMTGIELVCAVRERSPSTVCMMLTGNSDQETAMNAVNEGRIFRFMTKPCSQDVLKAALEAGIEQHRLITAEKELLSKTLMGGIKALADALALVSPAAFARSGRVKPIVRAIVHELKPKHAWQFEIGAMLSQIGCLVLPPETVDKICAGGRLTSKEREMYESCPEHARRLIERIPRLETCAAMIAGQARRYDSWKDPDDAGALGAQILHAAIAFDEGISEGLPRDAVIVRMRRDPGEHNPRIIELLRTISIPGLEEGLNGKIEHVSVWNLADGMFTNEEIVTHTGAMLVPKGAEITPMLIQRLKNFAGGVGVKEPIEVLVPEARGHKAA